MNHARHIPPWLSQSLKDKNWPNIVSSTPCTGGCINSSALITLSNHNEFFVKWNQDSPSEFFASEVASLGAIGETNTVKVPEVHLCEDSEDGGFLVLELLPIQAPSEKFEELLGEALARLHAHTEEQFGFHRNNFIGTTPQSNSWHDSWGEFFLEERLRPQVSLAKELGWLKERFVEALSESRSFHLEILNRDEEKPALLHGDLWYGNVASLSLGEPVLFDPASYYGHREADIAFTEFFGGFGKRFYDAYRSVSPLSPHYEERRWLHNLYHLFNHANLFGGNYCREVQRIIEDFSIQ